MSDIAIGFARLFHIGASCFIIGNALADVIWGVKSNSKEYLIISVLCYVFVLASGVIKIILIKPSKIFSKGNQRFWVLMIYLKFLFWILFIPIPDWIAESVGGSFPRLEFNAVLIFATLIVSVISKQFREVRQTKDELLLER